LPGTTGIKATLPSKITKVFLITTTMYEPDIKKFTAEINELKNKPAAEIEIPLISVLAIITEIQLTTSRSEIKNGEITNTAIKTAHQLQELFSSESEIYKVLELGWNLNCNERCPKPPCNN